MSATIQMVVIAAAILFAGGIAVGWFVAGGITAVSYTHLDVYKRQVQSVGGKNIPYYYFSISIIPR